MNKEVGMKFPRTIYAIQHNKTGRIYIGSTTNLDSRYRSHMSALRGRRHHNEEMQKDFDEYGEDYSLFVLEVITSYEDRFREYELMKEYGTFDKSVGYNCKDGCAKRAMCSRVLPIKEGTPKPNKTRTK